MTKYLVTKPKIVLFDWDNTIIETNGIFKKARSMLVSKLNLDQKIFETQEFKDMAHMSGRDKFASLFGNDWEGMLEEYHRCYKEILNQNSNLSMIEGAENFLKQLYNDNVSLGIVSNKSHDLLMNEVEMFGIRDLFTSIVGSGKALRDKPSEIHAHHAINEIISIHDHIIINDPGDCWLVGDSEVDVYCAVNAKCLPILINGSEKAVLEIQNLLKNKVPHMQIDSFEELIQKYISI
jgi:phosphoglycolate phosphatase